MKTEISDEYLQLLQQIVDEQYSEKLETEYTPEPLNRYERPTQEDFDWVELKPKLKSNTILDVTDYPSSKLEWAISSYHSFKIGHFTLRTALPPPNKKSNNDLFTLNLWEKQFITPSGDPCNMDFKKNIHKDSRFNTCPWIKEFSITGDARNINQATLINIIRWLQITSKLPAFL